MSSAKANSRPSTGPQTQAQTDRARKPQVTLAPPNSGTEGTWASTMHRAIIRAENSSFRRSRTSRDASRQ
ncbi:Uncharacterised protein [uncultured Blautia sp.]|nr:Uncharacterised protein [uncultured Blautia sp.]